GNSEWHGKIRTKDQETEVKPQSQTRANSHFFYKITAELRAGFIRIGVLQPDVSGVHEHGPMHYTCQFSTVFRIQFQFNVSRLVREEVVLAIELRCIRTGAKRPGAESPQAIGSAHEELLDVGHDRGIAMCISNPRHGTGG